MVLAIILGLSDLTDTITKRIDIDHQRIFTEILKRKEKREKSVAETNHSGWSTSAVDDEKAG